MPYSTGLIIFVIGLALVFFTFGYLLINARSLMRLLRPMSDGEISLGPGRAGPSDVMMWAMLIMHFVGWGIAAIAWLFLLVDVRATAPDVTGPEAVGIVDGTGDGAPAN